jgi:hypothetical protein
MVESFYLHRSHNYLSTIQNDFDKCHTIGYVGADNVTEEEGMGTATSIANPFVDELTINSTIAQKASGALDSAHRLNHAIGGNKL